MTGPVNPEAVNGDVGSIGVFTFAVTALCDGGVTTGSTVTVTVRVAVTPNPTR